MYGLEEFRSMKCRGNHAYSQIGGSISAIFYPIHIFRGGCSVNLNSESITFCFESFRFDLVFFKELFLVVEKCLCLKRFTTQMMSTH